MIVLFVLFYLCHVGSAVPLSAKLAPPLKALPSQRIHPDEVTETQTQAPLSPIVEPPQPSSQPLPSPQLLPPVQQYPWPPLGGSPLIFPFHPNIAGSQPAANQPGLPLQPMMFPSFGYLPVFPSPFNNQLLSPYRFPEAPLPQVPVNQAPHALPAETSLTAAPIGEVVQTQQQQQQQQNPQVVYMVQQPMNPQLGGLSSEELQIAAKMGQLGVYMPTVLNNAGSGPMQPVNQAAGITIHEGADVGALPAGVQKIQGAPCSNNHATGSRRAAPEAAVDKD